MAEAATDEMATASVNGAALVFDRSGAAWWPEERLLVVADLHFEKGSAFAARRGVLLPPYDTRETLARLEQACAYYRPKTVIALGDSFHDMQAAGRLAASEVAQIRALTSAHEWYWIEGNHDPKPPEDLGGWVAGTLACGPLTFRHLPQPGTQPGEVAGHLHPAAKVTVRGRGLRRRCFVTDGSRLILPSFGAYTGGLDVLDRAFAFLLAGPFHAWMIGKERVYPVASRKLG
ncbi:ligase-associated DNA damage response endonuclease PdeM [Iodidimonas sp. SYSU 1G8]|uniref:ligase-associated DNA damage response endonuclease PdeM n=1 Tax=Iodidimonas sp. SYSU 1G8 TaxID=3133967 RepID=UPI0031FED6E0